MRAVMLEGRPGWSRTAHITTFHDFHPSAVEMRVPIYRCCGQLREGGQTAEFSGSLRSPELGRFSVKPLLPQHVLHLGSFRRGVTCFLGRKAVLPPSLGHRSGVLQSLSWA